MSRVSKNGGVVLFFLVIFLAWLSLPSWAQTKSGALSLAQVKSLLGEWQGSDHDLDQEAIRHLSQVPKFAEVKVFFGTWCEDSQREVPRLLKVLSDLGESPFSVKFYQVDKEKKEPAQLLAANDIVFLPTFVVSRRGKEVAGSWSVPPDPWRRTLLSYSTARRRVWFLRASR